TKPSRETRAVAMPLMRVLRSLITEPTFPVAIIRTSPSDLLYPEPTLPLPGARARLFCAFNAPPFKTFVELAEHAPEAVAGRNVAWGDLDRPPGHRFVFGETNLLDPASLHEDLRRSVEEVGTVLEGLLRHRGAHDRPFLEEQAVAGVGHHALVKILDLAKLRLVDLDVSIGHRRLGHRGRSYIRCPLVPRLTPGWVLPGRPPAEGPRASPRGYRGCSGACPARSATRPDGRAARPAARRGGPPERRSRTDPRRTRPVPTKRRGDRPPHRRRPPPAPPDRGRPRCGGAATRGSHSAGRAIARFRGGAV